MLVRTIKTYYLPYRLDADPTQDLMVLTATVYVRKGTRSDSDSDNSTDDNDDDVVWYT